MGLKVKISIQYSWITRILAWGSAILSIVLGFILSPWVGLLVIVLGRLAGYYVYGFREVAQRYLVKIREIYLEKTEEVLEQTDKELSRAVCLFLVSILLVVTPIGLLWAPLPIAVLLTLPVGVGLANIALMLAYAREL